MDSATKILDIAERRMRQSGYNAVSYRDIAAEMGVKSASLHYHFQRKEDLGVALVKRYSENFYTALNKIAGSETEPKTKLKAFTSAFYSAYSDQKLVCLCAVLGAEAPGLPGPVTAEVRFFFERNISWLTSVLEELGAPNAVSSAKAILSLLEGAMIIASVNDNLTILDAAVDWAVSKSIST